MKPPEKSTQYIYGRNPVMEAIAGDKPIQKLYLLHGARGEKISQLQRIARRERIPLSTAPMHKLRNMVGNVNHQGVVALLSPVRIGSLEELLGKLDGLPSPRLLVLVDRIQDPHNMGAIIRSAEILGAQALLFSMQENVPVTEAVLKTSAGAALHLPLFQTHNLGQSIRKLKEANLWIYGAVVEAQTSLWQIDFDRDCAILIGGEEKGIRPSLQKQCDQAFAIPQRGRTQSLNASVAAGLVLGEALRQRQA